MMVRVAEAFLTGPASLLLVAAALVLGGMALLLTPREEEPQIVVPMVDVAVRYPGHSPAEVEQQVTTPLERLLWQTTGVEHVYSVSRRDGAMVTVRFFVGEDRERAMVRVRDKIDGNLDLVPPGVTGWQVNSVEIDDVPIVTLTLHGEGRTPYELRRIAEEMKARLDSLPNLSRTEIFGGARREIRIEPDLEDLAGRKLAMADLVAAIQRANRFGAVGTILRDDRTLRVLAGPGLTDRDEVANVVVGAGPAGLIRMSDVARVVDGPEEPENHVSIGFGPASEGEADAAGRCRGGPAVTLAFSKKKGTNAVTVSRELIAAAEGLRGTVVPEDVQMRITRDNGRTADRKVNDLVGGMAFGILSVVALLALAMGWREALVVGVAVPVSFALALFVNYAFGFTINRVTLFALILSLGMVVDDPITNVDNIQRHIRMGRRKPYFAALFGVHEVIGPVVMSTLAIIVSFTPMFFITGMMGPYMGPMAINVPLTVSFSTLCALTFVPWMAYRLLKDGGTASGAASHGGSPSSAGEGAAVHEPRPPADGPADDDEAVTPLWIRRGYAFVVGPFLRPRNAILLLAAVALLTVASALLMVLKVPLKMLPFDNKNELQLVVEMPEGTSLERTAAVVRELEDYLATVNEVHDFESYVGINAPIDFNGLVRHYGMRREAHQADIRVNLADRDVRRQQSHTIALRLRDPLTAIAERRGAVLGIVEVPPGPPVLSTLAVEIRGRPDQAYGELIAGARSLAATMRTLDSRHIAQIDDSSEATHDRLLFTVDRDKAAFHGLTVAEITATLRMAIDGEPAGTIHDGHERNPLFAQVRLPFADRNDPERLGQIWLAGRTAAGPQRVQLAELGRFVSEPEDQPIYHKNLERVVFLYAECVGRAPGEIIVQHLFRTWPRTLAELFRAAVSGRWRHGLPNGTNAEWGGEGEWEITVRVFRDLGIAFGVAMLGIFLLLILQTRNVLLPLIIMCAIPLTIIGVAPGFWLLNAISGQTAGGYADPVFFTATGMIGMIALGGIVIRNSIVLIEFYQDAVARGRSLRDAILASGAVRFRPIVLTALTTMMGAWPITLDPIFSGLAWALIFGLLASTAFTLLVIPAVYLLVGPKAAVPVDDSSQPTHGQKPQG
jgi:multidrug efflux pump subunit AcrB